MENILNTGSSIETATLNTADHAERLAAHAARIASEQSGPKTPSKRARKLAAKLAKLRENAGENTDTLAEQSDDSAILGQSDADTVIVSTLPDTSGTPGTLSVNPVIAKSKTPKIKSVEFGLIFHIKSGNLFTLDSSGQIVVGTPINPVAEFDTYGSNGVILYVAGSPIRFQSDDEYATNPATFHRHKREFRIVGGNIVERSDAAYRAERKRGSILAYHSDTTGTK